MSEFTLTENHLKLLRAMFVGWDDCESGAPAVDCKRPYGNSYVEGDIAEILGIEPDLPEDEEYSEELECKLLALHRETEFALQIVLNCGPVPGKYRQKEKYNTRDWEMAGDNPNDWPKRSVYPKGGD